LGPATAYRHPHARVGRQGFVALARIPWATAAARLPRWHKWIAVNLPFHGAGRAELSRPRQGARSSMQRWLLSPCLAPGISFEVRYCQPFKTDELSPLALLSLSFYKHKEQTEAGARDSPLRLHWLVAGRAARYDEGHGYH